MNFPIIDVYNHPHYGDSVRYENYVELQEVAEKLEARHNALCEAVAWERECEECEAWLLRPEITADGFAMLEATELSCCARAEVDRLLNEGADCRVEG